jgi:mRNA-decapping enzyme subunit 2
MFLQDHWRIKKSLRSLSLKEFTLVVFKHFPGLRQHAPNVDESLAKFKDYKRGVPVMGGILLDPKFEKCLLVKGCGKHATWGFPRGKVAPNESEIECAIREVSLWPLLFVLVQDADVCRCRLLGET